MDTAREIESLKQRLNELVKRQANPQPRPQLRRATIIEYGSYNCHKIEFRDGKFTKDLTTDDMVNDGRGAVAFVGDDFQRTIRIGDKVFVSYCEGRWWIVAKDDQNCIGYCIDDPTGVDYIWGWFFDGPELACCPEAGGPQMLTTSDAGVTYETALFNCNGSGTDRKWVFDGKKLYITPMLDAGNVQYQTDHAPENCTSRLLKYEGLIFPVEQCGPILDSVCLHPLCGTGGCDDTPRGTPLIYEATHGGGLVPNPAFSSNCTMKSPLTFYYEHNVSGICNWKTNIREIGPMNFTLRPSNSPPALYANAPSATWEMDSGPFDYYGSNEFFLTSSTNNCLNWPDKITVRPRYTTIVEANCNPLVWKVITDDGFAPEADGDVVCWEVPRFWFIEITGVNDDTCLDCDVFNGSFILDYFNGQLGLSSNFSTSCSTGSPFNIRFTWGLDSGTWYMHLYIRTGSTPYATYKASLGSSASGLNCVGANTLTLDSYSADCQNWPSTITVRPLT